MAMASTVRSACITIEAERCKGCCLCVSACPKSIIGQASSINKKGYTPAEIIEERAHECTGCALCAMMCPDVAITVFRRKPRSSDS
jgi:2-oxoglutarate ferredoxin oxidoreductase subunit delta